MHDDFSDLTPRISTPINIGGQWYVLREADMPTEDAYNAARLRGTRIISNEDKGTKQFEGFGGLNDVPYILIGGCLFKINGPSDGKKFASGEEIVYSQLNNETKQPVAVGVAFLRAANWPSRLRKYLLSEARKISELDDKETVEELEREVARLQAKIERMREGNPSSATEVSSS